MNDERQLLRDLDVEEFFSRLSGEGKLLARSAKVLKEQDVDGTTFMEMTVEDFKDIGVSLGMRKAMLRFRNRVLEMEADLPNRSTVKRVEQRPLTSEPVESKKCYSSEETADIVIAGAATEAWDDIDLYAEGDQQQENKCVEPGGEMESIVIGEPTEQQVDIDLFTPGEPQRNEYLTSNAEMNTTLNPTMSPTGEQKVQLWTVDSLDTTSDIFTEPQPHQSCCPKVEEDAFADCQSPCFITPVVGRPRAPFFRDDSVHTEESKWEHDRSPVHTQVETKNNEARLKLSQTSCDSNRSSKSMRLSGKSMLGKKNLKNWVFNRRVKWKEQGVQRVERKFMKLRSENEIVLEGYLQWLEGLNSRVKINHWTNRYGVLLKSGVFLHFAFNSKTLFLKGYIDINLAWQIEIPQSDISKNSLKIEIQILPRKRHVLAFTTKSELLMWYEELVQIFRHGDGDATEEDDVICLE